MKKDMRIFCHRSNEQIREIHEDYPMLGTLACTDLSADYNSVDEIRRDDLLSLYSLNPQPSDIFYVFCCADESICKEHEVADDIQPLDQHIDDALGAYRDQAALARAARAAGYVAVESEDEQGHVILVDFSGHTFAADRVC